VADLNAFMRRLRLYAFAFLCGLIAVTAFGRRFLTPIGSTDSDLAMAFLYIGLLSVMIGALCIVLDQLHAHTESADSRLMKRLTEQEERIRALEAQIAALTPPHPTH
jgi:hypothetical protein